jgi:hypothetical protein
LTRSPRCSSSPRRTRTRRGPTAAPPRRFGTGAAGRRARPPLGERELKGIGSGIESRLRELVQTGEITELVELERELAPDLIGLGRFIWA